MRLAMEGPRPLSPLEREAVELVFWDSIDPCDVHVTVVEGLIVGEKEVAARYGEGGIIFINRSKFPYTDALDINSRRTNTDKFKPANMNYLCRVIHECAHHWQSIYKKYEERGPYKPAPYDFSWEELQTLTFRKDQHDVVLPESKERLPEPHELRKEQYASAAQVYFVIAWQLRHSSNSLVNLTTHGSREKIVGPVYRYHEIDAIPHADSTKPDVPFNLCDPVPPGRRVSRECAGHLSYHFGPYLVDLRSGGREQWAG